MKKHQSLSFKYWFLSLCSRKNSSLGEGGYILVVAIAVVLGIAGLVALYAKTNTIDKLSATAVSDSNSGFYGAEAALNVRADQLRQTFLNYNQPTGTSPETADACFDPGKSNGSGDYQCLTYNYAGANTNSSDFSATTYVTEMNNGQPVAGVVPNGDPYQGLNMNEYGHSIYALSFKDSNLGSSQGKQANAILQMDVKSRLIPMFQFAAFYTSDLEILPGPTMTLSGPVHTNGDLYLGSGNTFTIEGQVTTVGDIYNKRKNDNSTYPDGRVKIWNLAQTPLNLLFNGTGSTSQTTNAMEPTRIASKWGSQVLVNTNSPISIPEPSILNSTGDYFKKADIRINFTPQPTSSGSTNYLNTVPFELTSINRMTAVPLTTVFTLEQRKSLRQPVMVGADLASIPPSATNYHLCEPDTVIGNNQTRNWWEALSRVDKNLVRQLVQDYVQTELLSSDKPILLTELDDKIKNSFADANLSVLEASLTANGISNASTAVNRIDEMEIQEVAGLPLFSGAGQGNPVADSSRCYIAAPIMEVGRDDAGHDSPFRFHNERENREIRVLQMNFQSMAVWNRDGFYLNSGTLTSTDNLLYPKAPADTNAPANSFQRLGLAALDDTQQGIVIHATINQTNYPYPTGKSPYAFAIVQGQQLFALGRSNTYPDPTGITVASDQAIYIQGDYNVNTQNDNSNYQPAGILADSFTPLSNACLNDDGAINHNTGINCDINGSKVAATDTEFNAALLAGTDVTNGSAYNGGLENYPRFLENWSGNTWRYRGSFVSIGQPIHVSGNWNYGGDVYTAPGRDWDYDTNFNDSRNLPPLTPQFVALKQESFIRSFEQ